jgi:nitroimidazol reductase NimA-like FMN-containing flavoprotein (pyridoxamine 5'-phosphate oxidase superfamily)
MDIEKMPRMKKAEYDEIINNQYICRIAFRGEQHPYIVPFLYVFDGTYMYFLSTKYGKKVEYFHQNPYVSVEVENYSPDLSNFSFVSLFGRLMEVEDAEVKQSVREMFLQLIKAKRLSANVLSALGHSPQDPFESILNEGKNSVWKLTGVKEILGLKNSGER